MILLLTSTAANASGEVLSYADLADRLVDLERLATPPPPGKRTALASSYNRQSQYDAAHDRYVAWDANGDGGGIVRRERDVEVLAEIDGPGCIWRIWSATAEAGHVKILLDGEDTPAVDLPFSGYFDRRHEPFTRPHLVYKTNAEGLNNYTPIPFQKSCRIIADPGWGRFYQFTYTLFAPGTTVPTFRLLLSGRDAGVLDRIDAIMANAGANPAGARAGEIVERKTVTIAACSRGTVAALPGPRAISTLRVKLELPDDLQARRALLAPVGTADRLGRRGATGRLVAAR